MIEAIVGSEGAERVLLFLAARNSGYAREIASCWSMDVSTVQSQLLRMERDSLLVSRTVGRTRLLSPTDTIKDRLLWWYLEGDRQCLEQAADIACTDRCSRPTPNFSHPENA